MTECFHIVNLTIGPVPHTRGQFICSLLCVLSLDLVSLSLPLLPHPTYSQGSQELLLFQIWFSCSLHVFSFSFLFACVLAMINVLFCLALKSMQKSLSCIHLSAGCSCHSLTQFIIFINSTESWVTQEMVRHTTGGISACVFPERSN